MSLVRRLFLVLVPALILFRGVVAEGIPAFGREMQANDAAITVQVGKYPHGIAVNETNGKVYVANSNESSVSVFDGASGRILRTVQVGRGPWDVAVDTRKNRVYVANIMDHTVTVLDGETDEMLVEIATDLNPWVVEVSERTGRVYTANYHGNSISVLDGIEGQLVTTIPLGPFHVPYGVAVDEANNRVYVGDFFHVMPAFVGIARVLVIDGATNEVVDRIAAPAKARIAYDAQHDRVVVAGQLLTPRRWFTEAEGELLVIDGQTHSVLSTRDLSYSPFGIALAAGTDLVYIADPQGDRIVSYNCSTLEVGRAFTVGEEPVLMAYDGASHRLFVANAGDDSVSIVDIGDVVYLYRGAQIGSWSTERNVMREEQNEKRET